MKTRFCVAGAAAGVSTAAGGPWAATWHLLTDTGADWRAACVSTAVITAVLTCPLPCAEGRFGINFVNNLIIKSPNAISFGAKL